MVGHSPVVFRTITGLDEDIPCLAWLVCVERLLPPTQPLYCGHASLTSCPCRRGIPVPHQPAQGQTGRPTRAPLDGDQRPRHG